jgi:hypothetical protein
MKSNVCNEANTDQVNSELKTSLLKTISNNVMYT